jgi:hypothetical protein
MVIVCSYQIVMELASGGDLLDRVLEKVKLPEDETM